MLYADIFAAADMLSFADAPCHTRYARDAAAAPAHAFFLPVYCLCVSMRYAYAAWRATCRLCSLLPLFLCRHAAIRCHVTLMPRLLYCFADALICHNNVARFRR